MLKHNSKAALINQTAALSTTTDPCYFSVLDMPDYFNWNIITRSVVQLNALVSISTGNEWLVFATGFLVNSNNNNTEIKPILITCAHLFYNIPNNPFQDYSSYFRYFNAYYGDLESDIKDSEGFNVKLLTHGIMSNINDSKNDYAILQADSYMSKLGSLYGFTYAGFTSALQTNETGGGLDSNKPYTIFHYIHDDNYEYNKRYLINYKSPLDKGDYITFLKDDSQLGFTNVGSSGAPVFNSCHQVIGINVSGANYCDDPDNQTNVICKLSKVFEIDPSIKYLLGNDNYTYDPNQTTPNHCSNCIQDKKLGETGIDCGGECLPCSDVKASSEYIQNPLDFEQGISTVKSLTINANTQEITANNDLDFNGAEGISISGNFSVNAGKSMSLSSGNPTVLFREKKTVCANFTIPTAMIYGKLPLRCFAPNTSKYKIIVYNAKDEIYYKSGDKQVWSNSPFIIYKGQGASDRSEVLYYQLELWGTDDQYFKKINGYFYMYPNSYNN